MGSTGQSSFVFPHRRVGFFAGALTPAVMSTNGWLAFDAAVRWSVQPQAVFVVATGALNSADVLLKARIESAGYNVRVVPGPSTTAQDGNGVALIVVSESVSSDDVKAKYISLSTPVITLEPSIQDDLGMTGLVWMSDYGEALNQTQLAITSPNHPLAAGLRGDPAITNTQTKYVWGNPSSAAVVAATILGNPTQAAIYAYAKGAQMRNGVAAGVRVGYFAGKDAAVYFNDSGWALFDATIAFATGRAMPTSFCSGRPDLTPCSDGNACNGAETCLAGVCATAQTLNCDDSNPCTTDMCSPQTGCVMTPKTSGSSCSDGDLCNGAETCDAAGQCNLGTNLVCNDGNDCTADTCVPATGCTAAPVPAGQSCNVANSCNVGSCSAAGSCVVDPQATNPLCSVTQLTACVYQSGGETKAVFGYTSSGTLNVYAAAGTNANMVSPGNPDRGQPSWLKPGSNPGAFVVPLTPGQTITWKVGNASAVSASTTGTPACTVSSGAEGTMLVSGGKEYLIEPLLASIAANKVLPITDGGSVGPLPGQVEVGSDGGATYSVPLWVPPGRNGMQPSLSLNYHSNGDNGLLGVGWTLSGDFSVIESCPVSRRVNPLRSGLCLDGSPLVEVGALSYRTKIESFTKVLKIGDNYKAYRKDGRILTYSLRGAGYSVTRIEDRFGNAMTIEYFVDSVDGRFDVRPRFIQYSLPGPRRLIEFQYEDRAAHDVLFSDRFVPRTTTKRLIGVTMKAPNPVTPQIVKRYDFGYHANASDPARDWSDMTSRTTITGRELLASIRECEAGGICRPATTFEYEKGSWDFAPGTFIYEDGPPDPAVLTASMSVSPPVTKQWEDVDEDGLPDFVYGVLVSGMASDLRPRFTPAGQQAQLVAGISSNQIKLTVARYYFRQNLSKRLSDGTWENRLGPSRVLVDRFFMVGHGSDAYPTNPDIHFPYNNLRPAEPMASRYPISDPLFFNRDGRGSKEVYIPELIQTGLIQGGDIVEFEWRQAIWRIGETGSSPGPLWTNAVKYQSLVFQPPLNCLYSDLPILPGPNCGPDNGGSVRFVWPQTLTTGCFGSFTGTAIPPWDRAPQCLPPAPRIYKEAFVGDTDGDRIQELFVDVAGDGGYVGGSLGPPRGTGYYLTDTNGDGKDELNQYDRSSTVPSIGANTAAFDVPLQIDLNGDGIRELIYDNKPEGVLGFTRSAPQFRAVPDNVTVDIETYVGDRGERIFDYDLDGRDDLLAFGFASTRDVGLLKGRTRRRVALVGNLLGGVETASFDADALTPGGQLRFDRQFVDINGDGLTDMVQGGSVFFRQGKRPDMLTRVHRGVGPQTTATTIVYSPISGGTANNVYTPEGCNNGGNTTPITRDCLRTGAWVVAKMERDAGLAPSDAQSMGVRRTFEYKYSGGYRDRESGASLGFHTFEVIDKDRVVYGPQGPKYLSTTTEFYLGSNGDPNVSDTLAYETPGFGFIIAGRPRQTVSRVPIPGGKDHITTTTYSYEARTYYGGATLGVNHIKTVETFDDATGACSGPERETVSTLIYSPDPMVGGEPLSKTTVSGTAPGCTVMANAASRPQTRRETIETRTYFTNANDWFVGLPETITTTTAESGKTLTQFQQIDYLAGKGVPKNIWLQPQNPSEAKKTVLVRNTYGQVVEQTESADASFGIAERTVRTSYDSVESIFPEQVSNALGHSTRTIVHPAFGAPLWTQDLNGNIKRTWYDSFFRPIQVETPNQSDSGRRLVTQTFYLRGITPDWTERSTVTRTGLCVGTCSPSAALVDKSSESFEQLDRMGRSVYTSTLNTRVVSGASQYTSKRRFFDKFGNVIREDIAFEEQSVGSLGANVPMGSRGCIDYTFDEIDRVITSVTRGPDMFPVAETRTDYIDLETVTTDAVSQRRVTVADDLGRTVSASALVGSSKKGTMRYVYGPSGQIESATDVAGNESRMIYDALGRRTVLNDPDTGTTTTTYNGFGEVMSEQDSRLTTTTFERDLLGRTLKQHVSMPADSNTGETAHVDTTEFVWDVGANGVAQLDHSTSADGVVKVFRYDSLGRMSAQGWSGAGREWAMAQQYDEYNRVSRVKYPEYRSSPATTIPAVFVAPEAEYVYHPRDGSFLGVRDPNDVKNTDSDPSTEQWYFRVDTRDDLGRRTRETFGNGVSARRTYDQQQGFLLDLDFRDKFGAPMWDLHYAYDAVGNLTSRERHVGVIGQSPYFAETFDYDEFHRMDTWKGFHVAGGQPIGTTPNWKVKYGYDELGNLTDRDTFGASGTTVEQIDQVYSGTGAQPHGITAMNWQQGGTGTNRSYLYDSAGRQWKRPGQTIRYTDFDLPRRIAFDNSVREANFLYDADGSRYRKEVWRSENLQDVTTYVGGLYERREQTGSAATTTPLNVYYIQAGDRTVAQIEIPDGSQAQDNAKYFHQDHLDSVSFTTNSNGAMESPVYHDPFGNRFDPTATPVMAVALRPAGLQNVTRGFTGHEMETEDFGLINMRGRMFDPENGRFITADPLVQSPLWGQSYNRFMYVMGNPLTYNDPSGFLLQIIDGFDRTHWSEDHTKDSPGQQHLERQQQGTITSNVVENRQDVKIKFVKEATADASPPADPNKPPGNTVGQQAAKTGEGRGTTSTGQQSQVGIAGARFDLLFDGSKLTLYERPDKKGSSSEKMSLPENQMSTAPKVIGAWEAVSGRPGHQSPTHQGEVKSGPIPEGLYLVSRHRIQEMGDRGVAEKSLNVFGYGMWPGGEAAWGRFRVWLEPIGGTDTKGRSGFSIHGGTTPGSAGCIDLCGRMPSFIQTFKEQNRDLILRVRY